MEGLGQPPPGTPVRHLYVHVPYCHKICPYCSFYKHTPAEGNLSGFAPALLAEARLLKQGRPQAGPAATDRVAAGWNDSRDPVPLELETVYFGGGTPTLLSTVVMADLLPALAETLDFRGVREWTMEVNPRTITPEKARVMRRAGVTRVSLGVQAWDVPTLEVLGRDHAPHEAEEAYRILREAGFPVVNIDLMFSVPGQPLEVWQETLDRTVALEPDHVSAYNLTYEEDTEFFERCRSGQYAIAEDRDASCFAAAMERLTGAGYEHYEISNYGRTGLRSLHNQSYWAGRDYAGLGPGAVSTLHGRRFKNVENTVIWQQGVLSRQPARVEHEEISPSKWLCERLALGLRTSEGLPAHWLESVPEAVDRLREEGLVELAGGRLRLTFRGRFVADGVASWLWEALG